MPQHAFNQQYFVTSLIDAGMPKQQAEIIGNQQQDLVDTHLATKQDIDLLHKNIDLLRKDMKHGFALQDAKMEAMQQETTTQIETLRKDMTIKLGSLLVIAAGVFALIVRF